MCIYKHINAYMHICVYMYVYICTYVYVYKIGAVLPDWGRVEDGQSQQLPCIWFWPRGLHTLGVKVCSHTRQGTHRKDSRQALLSSLESGRLSIYGKDAIAWACNPSTWELEARGSGVQNQPRLHTEFKASLGCVRLCLKGRVRWGQLGNDINDRPVPLPVCGVLQIKPRILCLLGKHFTD